MAVDSKTTIARMHHYVPRCYLKNFSKTPGAKNPQLFVADALNKKRFWAASRKVAVERDFHAVDLKNHSQDSLERALSEFESELSPAIERTIAACRFESHDDQSLIVNLIGILFVKNPRMRRQFAEFRARTIKIVMDLSLATPERWASQVRRARADGVNLGSDADDYQAMRKFLDEGNYEIITPIMEHLVLEFDVFDKTLGVLSARKWSFLTAPQGVDLVTSDHPVCLYWQSRPKNQFAPVGLSLSGTELYFPLSPGLALFGWLDEGASAAGQLDAVAVWWQNLLMMGNADRQLYARDDSFNFMRNLPHLLGDATSLFDDDAFKRPRDE